MKNKLFVILLTFAFVFPAMAQEEAAPTEKPLAGWDNGFFLRSADDQFKMKIGGRVQLKQETQRIQGAQKLNPNVSTNRPTTADTFSNTFSLRRGQLITLGTLFEKLDWSTVLHAGTSSTGTSVLWFADFTYNLVPYFRISGGTIQLPMDRMQENSSKGFLGIETPLTANQADGFKQQRCRDRTKSFKNCPEDEKVVDIATISRDAFGLPYDLGLRIDGDIGSRFSYAVGVGNGSGFQTLNANNELSYGLRLQTNILDAAPPGFETDFEWSEKPKLSIGAGTGFEDTDANDENVAGIQRKWSWTASGDIAFRYRGISMNSEIYHRLVRINGSSVEDTNRDRKLRDVGYYGNVGYYVIPHKLELALTAAQIFREGPDNNANEFGGGINWYLHKNNIKLQLDYTNVLDYDEVPGLNNATYHRIRTMFSTFL